MRVSDGDKTAESDGNQNKGGEMTEWPAGKSGERSDSSKQACSLTVIVLRSDVRLR